MTFDAATRELALSLLRARTGREPADLQITRRPLTGGLEAASVDRIVARYRDGLGRRRTFRMVAKQLQGAAAREAEVYRRLLARSTSLAPIVFRIERPDAGVAILFLESIACVSSWPWRDAKDSCALLRRMAEFHASFNAAATALPHWDFESELHASAVSTLEQLERLRRIPEYSGLASQGLRPVRRLIGSLARRRSALLGYRPFDGAAIHGDLHPGNVLVRRRGARMEPVLIDWGRARSGSALEDVSSWLQSLGYWEPEARRRHDTLLKEYLRTLGLEASLPGDLRAAYWIAGASNALTGALRYHCWRAASCSSIEERAAAAHTARDWLRVITRADALSS